MENKEDKSSQNVVGNKEFELAVLKYVEVPVWYKHFSYFPALKKKGATWESIAKGLNDLYKLQLTADQVRKTFLAYQKKNAAKK